MPAKKGEKPAAKPTAEGESKDAKSAKKTPKLKVLPNGFKTTVRRSVIARSLAMKALKAQHKMTHGLHTNSRRKVMTKTRFRRPKTFIPTRNPKDRRFEIPKRNKLDAFRIIRKPLTTEAAMKKIESNDTLVFLVDPRSNKTDIKAAVQKLYSIKVARVNTLNCPRNVKKAYVKLPHDVDAMEVANRIGII
ncbi:60S ribosomal protein L23A [Cichlidogyrus casuarinus]|uniref:60S ribosomal protein L23A n=1 Tax=Cichlidogyrus casuarinus TaxID=1844966 RepID=A0ABD2QG42_9PLAT